MENLSKVVESGCERIILFNTGVEFIMKKGSAVKNIVISDGKVIVDGKTLPDNKDYSAVQKVVLRYLENSTIKKLTANIDEYGFLMVIDTPLNDNKVVTDNDLSRQVTNVINLINNASQGKVGAFGCKSTCKRVHTNIGGLYINLTGANVVNKASIILNTHNAKYSTELDRAKSNGFKFNKYSTVSDMEVGYWVKL